MGIIYRPFACGCVIMMATWGEYAGGDAMDRYGVGCECVDDHVEVAYDECERWKISELLQRGWVWWENIEKKLRELASP